MPREGSHEAGKGDASGPGFGASVDQLSAQPSRGSGGLVILSHGRRRQMMRGGRELVLQYLESSMLRVGMGEEARFLFAFSEKKHPFFFFIGPSRNPPQMSSSSMRHSTFKMSFSLPTLLPPY